MWLNLLTTSNEELDDKKNSVSNVFDVQKAKKIQAKKKKIQKNFKILEMENLNVIDHLDDGNGSNDSLHNFNMNSFSYEVS